MHFILHSEFGDDSISWGLGHADYRYYFLLRAFKPALERIGTVQIVRDPLAEVDAIYHRRAAAGEDCAYFYFGPPNKILLGAKCPTFIVLAWEYSNIPNEIWDELGRSDWRVTLAALDGTIVLSNYSAHAIKSVMGEDFPVAAVPGAVWEYVEPIRKRIAFPRAPSSAEFRVRGTVFDTSALRLSADRLVPLLRPRSEQDLGESQSGNPIAHLPAASPLGTPVRFNGIVYASFLDPVSDRKNLHDLVTAFCFAFRDTPDATLVLKLIHWNEDVYRDGLLLLLSRLAPFKCRVMGIHALLDDAALAMLIGATSFYVNASYCEALCQSMMEFMSCGVPAIAPRHTAMEDYLDEEVAFIVASGREFSMWPVDPRQMWRCDRFRIEWESLRNAFLESYRFAKEQPDQRVRMGERAFTRMREYTATASIATRIRTYLETRRLRISPSFAAQRQHTREPA